MKKQNSSANKGTKTITRTKTVVVSGRGTSPKRAETFARSFLHGFSIHPDALKRVPGVKNKQFFAGFVSKMDSFERQLEKLRMKMDVVEQKRKDYVAVRAPAISKSRKMVRVILPEGVVEEFLD